MHYEVTLAGETHRVEVREVSGSVYEVAVNDEEVVRIDAFKTPRTVYSILIGNRQYEGSVDEKEDGSLDVHVGASAFDCEVVDERLRVLGVSGGGVVAGKQELRAQMPGKIVKVLVEAGQAVEADQGVVVIEAMKMENELKSPIAGLVTEVGVVEGDTVETDALLAVIEPPDDD